MTQYDDENFLVIENTVEHPIFPARQGQLQRNVVLKGDLDVKGAIYCNSLRAEGAVRVHGPVLAKREIELFPPDDADKTMIFRQGINAVRAISVTVNHLIQKSPVAGNGNRPLVIKGNVCSSVVSLENTVLLGNVRAENALLKDCIILGSPIITGGLQLENCLVISFQAGSVKFRGRNTLLVPYGISRSPILPEHFEAVGPPDQGQEDGEALSHQPADSREDGPHGQEDSSKREPYSTSDPNAWVRYIGFCSLPSHGCGERIVSCDWHYRGICPWKDVRFNPDDVIEARGEDGNPIWMLTLAHRIINLTQVESDLAKLQTFIKTVQTMDHMDEFALQSVMESAESSYYPEEAQVLRILRDPTLSGA